MMEDTKDIQKQPMSSEIITALDRLVSQLKCNRDILGDDFCKEVTKAGQTFMKELSESVGKNILHKLYETKPTKERLEAIITALPSVLSVKNDKGHIPIQQAPWNVNSVEYVGLLAREGVKYDVGGEGKRGGLLLRHPSSNSKRNSLQLLSQVTFGSNPSDFDALCRDVLKELWESGLLATADIRQHNLVRHSCYNSNQLRFEYLSNKCPDALFMTASNGAPLFHFIIKHREANYEGMQVFLRAALRHFPNELGLLFQKDNQGTSAFEVAISRYSKDEAFRIIRQCIPRDKTIPILHHVVKHAPQFISDFIYHYPHAMYLKDEQGDKRTYFQARIASGNTTFAKDAVFIASLSPDQIEMVDPVTDLYPFMVAASEETSDLDTVYYLLRREPKLVYVAPK